MPPQKYDPRFIPDGEEPNDPYHFTTKLTPQEEIKFQDWITKNKIPGANEPNFGNYDLRGFYKENPDYVHKPGQHFTDKFKQPGHETFSIESKYAAGRTDAGHWEGEKFIPPDTTNKTTTKAIKSNTNSDPRFIPDSDETGGPDQSDNEPSAWQSLTSGVSNWINEHPSIRKNIYGLTPEEAALTTEEHKKAENPHYPFKDASRTELAHNYTGAPDRSIVKYKGGEIGGLFDELRNRNTDIYAGHPFKAAAASLATEPARFLTELANDPFVLASGGPGKVFSKAGGAYGDLMSARARVPQVTDLGTAPSTQRLLGPGPRFQAEPIDAEVVADVADTRAGQSIPIRQSREIPYRPSTDIVSGDISPVRTEPFPYKTPQPEVPTGQLAQSFSTAYGDTSRAVEARRRFAEEAARQPITDESRLLPEGVRQPQINDLLLSEEGALPGEMSRSDALLYEPEFKPWRGLSNLSEAILGRDIMKRDINAGLDPHRGPIDWGPQEETSLTASRPTDEVPQATARFKGWQQTGYEDMPDFPLYDVEGGPSHGTTTDVQGLEKLGIEAPETPANPHAVAKSDIVYHGTEKDFTHFDDNLLKDAQDYPAHYFTDNPKIASLYAGEGPGANVRPAKLKLKNPFDIDKNKALYDELVKDGPDEFVSKLKEKGYDGITYHDPGNELGEAHRVFGVFNSNQISPKFESKTGKIGPYADATVDELISAVKDGKKPSAILENIPDQRLGIYKAKAKMAGLHITENPLVEGEPIISKDPEIGSQLAASLTTKNHETTGKLLGYSDEDIQAFKDNEVRLDAAENKEPQTFLERLKSERGSAPVGRDGKPKKPESAKAPEQPKTPVQSALKKLANAVISSKGLREEQELLYKKEQARRFAAFGRVKTTGEAGARESLGKLKGELPKLNIEELQLTPVERDSLFDSIKQSNISNGEKATGYQALYKLLSGGHVPQRGELHILDTVFGGGMGMEGGPGAASEYEILSNILKAAAEPTKARPIKESSMIRQIYEIPRGLMSVDIPFMSSAAFRQGVGLAGTSRWFQAVGEQARVFGSEKVYDKIMKDLDNNIVNIRRVTWNPEKQRSELKSIADQIGLKTSDLKNITRREEQIKSSLTERIPGLGAYIRASNRSYTTMLNSLRTHTAEDWIKAANILDKNGNITDLAKARRIGYTINELSGGSSLDIDKPFSRFTGSGKGLKLDKFSDELSMLFFSPKMLVRDARMINPLNYIKTDKLQRLEYLKGAMRRAAVWAGFTGLAALALGAVVSSNITSSDFAKARIKDTRADAGSGLLQWMVLISRQALGKNTSSTSGRTTELGSTVVSPTRMDLLTQFAINRLHPTIGLGALALTATKTRPFYPISSTVEHVTPMYTSDIHDLMNSDPEIRQIILGLAAGSLSMGSITYGREDYGKPQYKIPYDPKFEGGPFSSSRRNPPMRKMNLSF